MGWREQYRNASFRNVKFFVERTESTFGRRAVVHEFPARDEPTTEDLGRKARRFTVEAYLLGDDFFDQKESLIRAAEKAGPGQLIHPYYGTLQVVCMGCSIRDTRTELRMTRIEMSFVEAGASDTPGTALNAKASANLIKVDILAELEAWFQAKFGKLAEAFAKLDNVINTVNAAYATIDGVKALVSDVAEYRRKLDTLLAAPASLVASGADLVRSFTDLVAFGTYPTAGDFVITPFNAAEQFKEMRKFFDFITAGPADPADDATTVADVMQAIAVGTAGGMIAETPYVTYEDAKLAVDIVLAQIDALLDTGRMSDEVHEAFRIQRVSIVNDLDARSENLSRLVTKVLPEGIPAIVLSNELYGDVEGEQDILDRNGIDHPGFVPARVDLDVVIDAE
jgi:prophage DNA circulation protein